MIRAIKTGLAAILLLTVISCTKENTKTSSTATRSTDKSVAAHYIGERYGGGIIFYIDSTGQHGLIVDTTDLGFRASWSNKAYTTTGATATRIGSGKANTRKIILSQGDSGKYAALRCANSRRSGYTDWYLPSKNELNQILKQRALIYYQQDALYWSSTEIDSATAWAQHPPYFGSPTPSSKEIGWAVRAIRAF